VSKRRMTNASCRVVRACVRLVLAAGAGWLVLGAGAQAAAIAAAAQGDVVAQVTGSSQNTNTTASQDSTLPAPIIRISFADAIRRAQDNNPTVAAAAASILRAEGLIRQARSASLFQLSANVTSTTLNRGVEFDGATVTPRSQLTATVTADMPILAAAAWARRAQAEDTRNIAELNVADVKRQIAFATADAYLSILASRRVVESNRLARDTAKAHFDLATELEQRGSGSRLNALRAQQQWSTFETQLETARLALYRAQEALGVLVGADAPVDAAEEPSFDVPPDNDQLELFRTDLKLFSAEQRASERILRDSTKDWFPTVDALFQPSTTYPSPFFLPANSWQFLLRANIPVFDSGSRTALKVQREAEVNRARETFVGAQRQATAEVRSAREAVASSTRGLASARTASEQAQQVLDITNISFRAGASTNIEVIDAQRAALDAENAAAVAEDALRRARLELLNALGRFPQ